ncbi:MAG: hypothetical protein ACOC4E_02935 [Patescibacteria group bacterium]
MDVPNTCSLRDQQRLRELEERLPTLPLEEWAQVWEELRALKDDTSPRIRVLRFQLLMRIEYYVQQERAGKTPDANAAVTDTLRRIVADEF